MFQENDVVLALQDIDQIPAGTMGVVVNPLHEAALVAVEFYNEEGESLGIFNVKSTDIQLSEY